MAVVAKKSKKGSVKKAVPEKPQSKFISQAVSYTLIIYLENNHMVLFTIFNISARKS